MGVVLSRSLNAAPVYIVNSDGQDVNFIQLLSNLSRAGATTPDATDVDGNPVPINRGHTYTYDASGNLATDTVTDGTNTWVRTYTTGPTGTTADSGWVKQ